MRLAGRPQGRHAFLVTQPGSRVCAMPTQPTQHFTHHTHPKTHLVWKAMLPPHTPSMLAPHILPASVRRCLKKLAHVKNTATSTTRIVNFVVGAMQTCTARSQACDRTRQLLSDKFSCCCMHTPGAGKAYLSACTPMAA
jgi:hypothetical protein